MTYISPLQPGEAWTSESAAAFVAYHAVDVAAEFVRLQAEVAAVFPGGDVFAVLQDAQRLVTYDRDPRSIDGVALAWVQVRTGWGEIHTATVLVLWETGEVVVRGWPLDEGSGWIVPG